MRTFNTGDQTVKIGTSPFTQTGILKAQSLNSVQKRINAGYNYMETFFGYEFSDGSFTSLLKNDLLQALGAVRNNNN